MFEEMIEQLTELVELLTKDDKLFRGIAKMTKKYYDILVEEGFTEEQAIKIVANHSPVNLSK